MAINTSNNSEEEIIVTTYDVKSKNGREPGMAIWPTVALLDIHPKDLFLKKYIPDWG